MMKIKAIVVPLCLCLLVTIALASCGSPAAQTETTTAGKGTEQTAQAGPETEAETGGAWADPYKAVLDKAVAEIDDPFANGSFALIYLDGDDTPELVVQPADYHTVRARLYSFNGGRAVDLGEYGSWGRLGYVPKKGVIIDAFNYLDVLTTDVSELKDGEIVKLCTFTENMRDKDNVIYSFNDKTVSEDEFNAMRAEYMTGELIAPDPDEGAENTYPLTAAGVEAFAAAF